jgi:hypothetical protein
MDLICEVMWPVHVAGGRSVTGCCEYRDKYSVYGESLKFVDHLSACKFLLKDSAPRKKSASHSMKKATDIISVLKSV